MSAASDRGKPTAKPPKRRPREDLKAYAESRGAALAAAAIIIAGQVWLANRLALRPVWLFPVVSGALLLASVGAYRSEAETPSPQMLWFARGAVAVLALANAVCLFLLVRGVFVKSALDPLGLLLSGLVLWVVNVAVFALAYWEIDGGGPEDRAVDNGRLPDLVFPQQQSDQQGLAPDGWQPSFSDYLYVSVTASTAFSPTDAMPYSRTAKLIMGLESAISFAIVAMLVARAVNVAKG